MMHCWNKMWSSILIAGGAACALVGCDGAPLEVGSNQTELSVSKVDVLMVVDNSGSMQSVQDELGGMLERFAAGGDPALGEFEPLDDVHLGVVTTDLGALGGMIPGCDGLGNDGIFVPLSEPQLEECGVDVPSFLSYSGEEATAATVSTIGCLPDVGTMGCGFEQPMEAGLKALWPASDDSVSFAQGTGHGDAENAGFLRDDSLLVVIFVSDEDDCSAEDGSIFSSPSQLDPSDPLAEQSLNLRCPLNDDKLHTIDRYVDGLRALRPASDRMLVVGIGGVPPELIDADAQEAFDRADPAELDAYYDAILEAPTMQNEAIPSDLGPFDDRLRPVCTKPDGGIAYPARRMVKLLKAFGPQSVLGSVCDEGLSDAFGAVIRAAAERLDPRGTTP